MTIRTGAAAAVAVALLASGCSGSDGPSASATRSAAPSSTPSAGVPSAPPATIDPAVPLTKTFTTKVFRPGLSLRLPADWYPTERDVSAFQAYRGDEDFEITLDHSYQKKESVDQGVARLSATQGLTAGPLKDVTVGGRTGKAFIAQFDKGVRFPDTGFHANDSGPMALMVLPVPDGTTVTVYLLTRTDRAAALPGLMALTDRIFATVRWA
jgi:hypothetical protein